MRQCTATPAPVIEIHARLALATLVVLPAGAVADVGLESSIYAEWNAQIRHENLLGQFLAARFFQIPTGVLVAPGATGGPNIQYGPEALVVAFLDTISLPGISSYTLIGETDPWMGFRMEFQDMRDAPTFFRLNGNAATVDLFGDSDVEVILDVTVLDTSGDGNASFTEGFGVFEAWHFEEFVFNRYPGADGFAVPDMLSPGTVRQIGASGTENPAAPFGGTLFDELNFFGGGIVSPGDTVIFEGFTCLVPSGGACPEPPDLAPVPAALPLFLPGLHSGFRPSADRRLRGS